MFFMESDENMLNRFVRELRLEISYGIPGFDAQKRMSPSIREDLLGNTKPNEKTRQSAVLILIFPLNGKLSTIFIKRPTYEGPHSGQVSFPGGKFDEVDETLIETALRETHEEIGIDTDQINIIGPITPLYIPVSNMMVTPVIGFIESLPALNPNVQEVEYTITVSIDELINPKNKSVKIISAHGKQITAPYYNVSNETIWGATAMILSEFLEIICRIRFF